MAELKIPRQRGPRGGEARPGPEPARVGRHVLVVVQNLPVPLDRRVWLECQALVAAGYDVSVICPKGPGDPSRQVLEGVALYKYRPAPPVDGAPGYAWEFAYSWARTALLSLAVHRRGRFDVLQACNPPDTYWLLARPWRLRGVRFVFDHHDLNPELFRSRFGEPTSVARRLELRLLAWLERRTFATADHVISTNESYRRIAIVRGGCARARTTVVRSGPDTTAMRPVYPPAEEAHDRHRLVYLGIMGPQDGVEHVLEVMDELVHRRGRADVEAVLLGFGDCYDELRRRATLLGLDDVVTFTGRADRGMVATVLSGADIGLGPDPRTPLNDLSTMNKTMEYMAYCLPSVAFDLTETRVSGGDAVLYAEPGDVAGFADAVERLLDDPELRAAMGARARERVVREHDWARQREAYVGVYDDLFGLPRRALPVPAERGGYDESGRAYVPLEDREELARFIRERTRRPTSRPTHRSAGARS